MFEMHILLISACAEEAEIWCNSECFIAYSAPWAQMEWILKKPKCEVLSWWASWFLMVQRVTLFMDYLFSTFFFFLLFLAPSEQVSVSTDGIVMAEERQGSNWKGHAQGVRGDTEKSISLHFHSIHMPNSVFRLTGYQCLQHAFWAGGKKGKKNQFPISLNYTRFSDTFFANKKVLSWEHPHFAWQFLVKSSFAFILLHLTKDRMHSSLSVAQSSDKGGKRGFGGCRMDECCSPSIVCGFFRATGLKIKAVNEWGIVRVSNLE